MHSETTSNYMNSCTRQSEDFHLLSALKAGERNAFDKLFRRYYPMLCAYCHRFVELEDAEEIVQDVMLWLWERRETILIESSLSQYLFQMVRHRALNRIHQQNIKGKADTLFYEEMQDVLQNTDFYQVEELTRHIRHAIAALPDSYREAFVMHRFRNMSYKEIATALNVSPKTIDYRIQQALKLLRTELKEYLPLLLFLYEA